MRAKDVKIGDEYLARVGSRQVRVRVVSAGFRENTFRVARRDNGLLLPSARRASALHPLPGTELERKEDARLARAASRRKPRLVPPKSPHAAMSCREYARELRAYADACVAAAIADPKSPFHTLTPADMKAARCPYIRRALRAHLENRATWLACTVLPGATFKAACLYERRFARNVSRLDCQVAGMLGADPEVVSGLRRVVTRG